MKERMNRLAEESKKGITLADTINVICYSDDKRRKRVNPSRSRK